MSTKDDRLIWIDLEMTGLDTQRDSIIEIATIVTTFDLETVAEGPVVAIHQTDTVLAGMDDWNTRQHAGSGLTERVRASRIDAAAAARLSLEFLSDHLQPGASPMCGNSICQDRRFMAREMPELEAFFHYRNLDVSTLKILSGMWAPKVLKGVEKNSEHLVMADIRDSIAELAHYRAYFLHLEARA